MIGEASALYEAVQAELANGQLRAKLIKLAMWRTRSLPVAEDLVQSALAHAVDPDGRPWDPKGRVSLFSHVGSIMNGLAMNASRSFHTLREVVDSGLARNEEVVDTRPLADEALAERENREFLRRVGDALQGELEASDPLAAAVLRASASGLERFAEIASAVPCDVDQVEPALKRIRYLGKQICERELEADRLRMEQRRKANRRHLEMRQLSTRAPHE